MSDIKYENMAENYNIVWLMNKLKLLCSGVDSNINKIYTKFHTLKYFTWYVNRMVSWWRSIFLLSKGNLTKHEKLEKSERDDGNNTNPEKVVEDKFLAMDFIGCSDPVR